MSTISRLESKYSDVLGRRRRKEQQQREQDDRDKTLEPEKMTFAPLARSATTILSSGAVSKKESTPYRLNRNYSDRKPTLSTSSSGHHHHSSAAAAAAATSASSYKPRSEFNALQHSASSAVAIPKSSYYESPIMRHKDTVYDIYGTRIPTTSRYDYDRSGALTTSTGGSYGYYDGRDKENTYKSKYEPSRLYAELNNNEPFSRDRNIPRYHSKGYRKTATTHLTNFDDCYDMPSTSGYTTERSLNSSSRYAPRKSLGTGYQRSQTQKFFDSEKSSVLRSLDSNKIDDEPIKSAAVKEREARRKEIQGLIAKYAAIDDVYLRAIDADGNGGGGGGTAATSDARTSITAADFSDLNSNIRSNGSVLDGQANDYLSSGALGLGPSYPYTQGATKSSFLALSKTQSVSSMSSVNRTRIPKTLATFVRIWNI